MTHRFWWTLLSSCLPHISCLMLNTTHGRVVFPMPNGFLRGWTMRSSTSLASCLLLLFTYMLNLLFFLFFFFFSLFVMTPNVGNCNKGDLLLVTPLILHISLGQSMLIAWMALLRNVLCPVSLMSWAILSLPTLEWWVLSSLYPLFFRQISLLVLVINPSSFKLQPTLNCSPLSKSMRSWYSWSGISS